MSLKSRIAPGLAAAAVAAALLNAGAGLATAQTVTGWTGPTPPHDGVVYLHNSSVSNDSGIVAKSKLWTATGQTVAPGYLAVRARLFKSGALCDLAGYEFNTQWAASLEVATSAGCGAGSYNSHGFIKVNSTSGTHEYVTFPSNPINYSGTATARSAQANSEKPPTQTTSVGGKTYGPHNGSDPEAQPDYIAAYADSGRLGYVSNDSLDRATKRGTQLTVVDQRGNKIGSLTVK
ncbi:hypothetical protein [Gordonia sp. NPDC127522]|uniref:hypothetical protein n=1 Tax=Gordonia sp. NPDC127522 TaxID=3345390 RepID=UPI0036297EB6